MTGFWNFKLTGAVVLLSLVVMLRWRGRGGQRITPLPHREDMQNMQTDLHLLSTTLINISLKEPAHDSIAQESITL